MSNANDIREFVNKRYIEPARTSGLKQVTVGAGDVHSELKLKDRMPAVTSALGATLFEKAYRVKCVSREGPQNGANFRITFSVEP